VNEKYLDVKDLIFKKIVQYCWNIVDVVLYITFRVAAMYSTNLPTFFCHRVTAVVHTVESVVASTTTKLGTAISKNDLTRLSVNTEQSFEQRLRSQKWIKIQPHINDKSCTS